MKEITILRHADWNFVVDELTDEARQRCKEEAPNVGPFTLVVSSPLMRAQEMAHLLSNIKPNTDSRASILDVLPEYNARILELRRSNKFGAIGAIISIPELRGPLRNKGLELKELVAELFKKLKDGQCALIVSHDGTIVAFEKILNNQAFDVIDHSYGELEGFRVTENLQVTVL